MLCVLIFLYYSSCICVLQISVIFDHLLTTFTHCILTHGGSPQFVNSFTSVFLFGLCTCSIYQSCASETVGSLLANIYLKLHSLEEIHLFAPLNWFQPFSSSPCSSNVLFV